MSVRHALLGLLAQQPRHGYELHAAFEAMVGGEQNWDLKPAQVYTTLSRLEKGGLVTQEAIEQAGGPEKVIYSLTAQGQAELDAWLSEPVPTTHQRDEFFVKLMLCIATENGHPRQIIYTQRSSLYRELHALTNQRADADSQHALAHILLMDQAIMRVEADLRWLDMVETRLDEIASQPLPEPESRRRGRPPKGDKGSTYPPPS
ncbi:MAG TPA: PadR family transcriptional regulator [Chloroflexi bacterium]|nr:PadR family transcriptional regulator [Chloroflexota bacterium]